MSNLIAECRPGEEAVPVDDDEGYTIPEHDQELTERDIVKILGAERRSPSSDFDVTSILAHSWWLFPILILSDIHLISSLNACCTAKADAPTAA